MGRFENGWVKIHRRLTHPGNDIGSNGYRLAIMTTLIAWANREESTIQWNGKPRKIQRGQVVIGVRDFAEHLKFSKDTVWRQIDYLCKRDTICKEAATEGTLITILNYETYQDNLEDLRQECDTDATQAGRDSGRQPNASRYPNGEVKKRRRKEYSSNFDFESLYKKYPRKEGKASGMKICARDITTQEKFDQLSKAVDNYALRCVGKEEQFVKLFSTFMACWEDYLETPANSSGGTVIAKIPVTECSRCNRGLIRAINKSSGIAEWTACSCVVGRAKSGYVRFDENRFDVEAEVSTRGVAS